MGQDRVDIDEGCPRPPHFSISNYFHLKPGKHAFRALCSTISTQYSKGMSQWRKGPLVEITGSPVLDTAEGLDAFESGTLAPSGATTLRIMNPGQFTDRPIFWLFLLVPRLLLTSEAPAYGLPKASREGPAQDGHERHNRELRKRLAAAEEAMKAGKAKSSSTR